MVDPVTARARALVDGAIDRVFDEPFVVRSGEELEELVAAGPVGTGTSIPTVTGVTAFVAAALPAARRAWSVASKSGKIASAAPIPASKALKVGLATLPVALRLSTTARRGVREVQLLASYVMTRLRELGIEPERGLVRSLTLSLYLDPARRPALDIPSGRAIGGVSRQWVLRSLGGDAESSVRARARRQAEAIDRLDLAEIAQRWAELHPRPPELTPG
jgi:hypothetical protein